MRDRKVQTTTDHEADTLILGAALPDPIPTPGLRLLSVAITLLTLVIFLADLANPESLHIGVLFNICIALTLWAWRPHWVIVITVITVLLRLLSYALDPWLERVITQHFHTHVGLPDAPGVNIFNLSVGIAVQTLTGALIWRQVEVQKRLEVRELQARRHAVTLAQALSESDTARQEAEGATRDARQATDRERIALLREVEARQRERATFLSLERVKNLSLALSRAVLPEVPTHLAGGRVALAARYEPAEQEIQIGDFYDILALNEAGTRFGLVIGDVAGHGVEAAAQTALVTTTLRACAFGSEEGPAEVLSRTARTLEGQLESFVSLFYGVYDADTSRLTYANAGHEPPILLGNAPEPTPLNPTGPLLGLGLGPTQFDEEQFALHPGQTLILMTDGLTEVRCGTDGRTMLDWEGLATIAAQQAASESDAGMIADGILADVRAYATRLRLTDDVALVVARVLS